MTIKLNDLLGIALLLIGIHIFIQSLNTMAILGLIGSTILIIIEAVFLFQFFMRKRK